MAGKADKGTKTFKIVAEVDVDQESMAAAQQEAADGIRAAAQAAADAAPVSERPRRGGSGARDAAPKSVDVDAVVKAKTQGIAKDVQASLDDTEIKVKVDIDTTYLRKQMDAFFAQVFTAKINVQGAAGQAFDEQHRPDIVTGAPASRGAPPEDVVKAMTKGLRDSIDALYRNLNEAFSAAGKGRFGSQSLAPGNQIEKATELIEQFGGKFSDLLQLDTSGPIPKVTGGKLSARELGEALGIDPNSPILRTVQEAALGLTATNREGGVSTRSADILMTRLSKWVETTPTTAAPAAAAEQTAAAVTNAIRQEGGGLPGAAEATPALDRLSQAAKALRASAGKVPFQDFDLALPRREVRNEGGAPPDDDPEATAQAISQLLPNQRGGRGLIGRMQPKTIGGINVDVEDMLQDLRAGKFTNLFETKETKTSPSRLIQLQPQTEEEEARAAWLSRSQRQVTIEGVGRATPLGPTGALRAAITKRYDEAIAEALFSDQSFVNLVRLSAQEGSRPKQAREPGMPVPGSGEAGGVTWASGHGPQAGYQAAYRLAETQAELEHQYKRLDDLQGSGKSTSRVEEKIAQLEARESRLIESAAPIIGATPEQARAMAEADRLRGGENRERIADRFGLSQDEIEKRALQDPALQGRKIKEQGGDALLKQIIGDALTKLGDPNFAGQRTTESGEIERFPESTAQAINRALKEVSEPYREGLPDKGPLRQDFERVLMPSIYRAFNGERERVMVSNIDDSRGTTEERRGGFAQINQEAEQAVDRAEGGRGRGRVARLAGQERTGASAPGGQAEMRDVAQRPTTDLDAELMRLRPEYEAAAGAVALAEHERQRRNISRRTGPGRISEAQPVEDILFSPPVRKPGGGTAPRGLTSRVTAEVEENFPVGQRVRDIKDAKQAADELLAHIATQTEDINEQRRLAAAAPAATSSGIPGSVFAGARHGDDATAFQDMVRKEALDVLEARTAAFARSADTRASRDPQTGDEARARRKKAGGVAAGDPESMPTAAEASKTPARSYTDLLRKEANPPGGHPPAPPGGGEFDDISGPIHVIIDGQPVRVAWAGGSTPIGSGISGRDAAVGVRDEATVARARARRMTSEQNMKFVDEFITKQRAENKSDTQIKQALKAFGFAGTAALALEDEGRSTVGAAGGARDRNARRVRLGLEPLTARTEEFFDEIDKADKKRADLAARARRAERGIPKRGFTASVTDIFSNLGGFLDSQVAAVGKYQREGQQLSTILSRGPKLRDDALTFRAESQSARRGLASATAEREAALASGDKARAKELKPVIAQFGKDLEVSTRQYHDARRALVSYNAELRSQSKRVNEAEKALPSTGSRAAAFGIGFLGAAGAVAVGQLVSQLATMVMDQALMPAIEKALGEPSLVAAQRTALGEQTRGAGGKAGIGVATVAAQTGLSGATFERERGLLEQVAGTQAGNTALTEQINLLKLADVSRALGGDAGVSRGLGGFLGTFINQTPSTDEQLGNFMRESGVSRRTSDIRLPWESEEGASSSFGNLIGDVDKLHGRLTSVNDMFAEYEGNLVKFTDGLEFSREELNKQVQSLRDADLDFLADAVRTGGVAATNQKTGELLTGEELRKAMSDIISGRARPSVEASLAATADQRRGQALMSEAMLNFRLQTTPQQTALGLARQGFGSTGGPGRTGTGGIAFAERDNPEMIDRVNEGLKETKGLYAQVNDQVDRGIASMRSFVADEKSGFSPAQIQEFNSALDDSLGYAKDIASIEIGLQTKQAAYAAAQFSLQIDLTKRSLKDAKGLVSGIGDSLGAVERQMFDLQRQSQKLSLGQSQRQINFQVAVAGFQAPGLTSEEREARINAAKEEAKYAQQQLDIQKKLFGLGGKQFDISAARQVQDLGRQLGLLEQGRELVFSTVKAEKDIKAITALAEEPAQRVEAFYQTALQRQGDVLKMTVDLATATGKGIAEVSDAVITAHVKAYRTMIREIYGSFNQLGGQSSQDNSPDDRNALGMVASETGVGKYGVAGEAGGEAVAILRDPKQLVTPLDGGGTAGDTYQIIVQGNTFSTEEDEERIMRKIVAAVEEAQGRKAALTGLRPFGG